jgi:hypothetical protein
MKPAYYYRSSRINGKFSLRETIMKKKIIVASFVFAIAAVALISSETMAAEQSSSIQATSMASFGTDSIELKGNGRGGGGKGSCDRKRDGSGDGSGQRKRDGSGPRSGNGTCDGSGNGQRKGDGSGNGTCDGTGPKSQDGTCPNK